MTPNTAFVAHNHRRYLDGIMQDLIENNEWMPLPDIPIETPTLTTTSFDTGPNKGEANLVARIVFILVIAFGFFTFKPSTVLFILFTFKFCLDMSFV